MQVIARLTCIFSAVFLASQSAGLSASRIGPLGATAAFAITARLPVIPIAPARNWLEIARLACFGILSASAGCLSARASKPTSFLRFSYCGPDAHDNKGFNSIKLQELRS